MCLLVLQVPLTLKRTGHDQNVPFCHTLAGELLVLVCVAWGSDEQPTKSRCGDSMLSIRVYHAYYTARHL
jgi:hypothetical protein